MPEMAGQDKSGCSAEAGLGAARSTIWCLERPPEHQLAEDWATRISTWDGTRPTTDRAARAARRCRRTRGAPARTARTAMPGR
eukprot:scaffold23715_cov36-Phaeocystis_antarctica.AAC.1